MTTLPVHANSGKLLGLLMQAGSNPNGWKLFLNEFVEVFNLRSINLLIVHKEKLIPKFHEEGGVITEEQAGIDYIEKYIFQDPLMLKMMSNPESKFIFLDEECPLDQFWKTPFYLEWDKKYDIQDAAAAHIFEDDGWVCHIILNRSHSQPLFSPKDDGPAMDFFLPLIKIAVQNSMEFQNSINDKARSKAIVHAFRIPVAVFTEFGDLWAMNEGMESLILNDKHLSSNNKQLIISDEIQNKQFQRAVFDVLSQARDLKYGNSSDVVRLTDSDVSLAFAPLSALTNELNEDSQQFTGGMVYAIDSKKQKNIKSSTLQKLFGFTPSESETCQLIISGLTPKKIAEQKELSEYTIREYIKRIYQKTGCNNQISLMNLLCSLPVLD
ncbi:helix-turn-helix transcriptional regulator [Marinicellulosiphila megalodicopiae]|uniref:helix-turn-helix transcriptional regulator n=1 Tax=Marinicellulosiphila megalodicopiae TaxID=2724896 RepID=UPI003BAF154D